MTPLNISEPDTGTHQGNTIMEGEAKWLGGSKINCKAMLIPQTTKRLQNSNILIGGRFHFELTLGLSHSIRNISERFNRLQGISSKINKNLDL